MPESTGRCSSSTTGQTTPRPRSRAKPRDAIPSLKLSALGMEFASEMVIKAGKQRLQIDEVPIAYRVRVGESKLSRFGDAWRHIRFMLVYSPAFLFLLPGGAAAISG